MWNKIQVVMLPTNEKAKDGMLCLRPSDNKLAVINVLTVDDPNHIKLGYKNQHLHFLSDEIPKEDEWCIDLDTNKVFKLGGWKTNRAKKIIATTDSSLINIKQFKTFKDCKKGRILPQPSQDFIKVFVEEYNKGNVIEWVDVLYNENISEIPKPYKPYSEVEHLDGTLKVNSKNEITIRKIKDSWSREEVEKLWDLILWYDENSDVRPTKNYPTKNGNYFEGDKNKWISENL